MDTHQTEHIEQLALAELDVAQRQLADAGRTIDELRSDVLALAVRVDAARTETDVARQEAGRGTDQAARDRAETQRQIAYLQRDLRQSRDSAASLAARLQESESARADMQTTIHALEAHIARLKAQLASPVKLVVKKALRRGRYAKSSSS